MGMLSCRHRALMFRRMPAAGVPTKEQLQDLEGALVAIMKLTDTLAAEPAPASTFEFVPVWEQVFDKFVVPARNACGEGLMADLVNFMKEMLARTLDSVNQLRQVCGGAGAGKRWHQGKKDECPMDQWFNRTLASVDTAQINKLNDEARMALAII